MKNNPPMNNNNFRTLIWIFLMSFIVDIAISPFRTVNFGLSSVVGFALYFTLTTISIHKCKELKANSIFIAILLGLSFFNLPFKLLHFESSLVGMPDYVWRLLATAAGYGFCVVRTAWRWAIIAASIVVCIAICPLYDYWEGFLKSL